MRFGLDSSGKTSNEPAALKSVGADIDMAFKGLFIGIDRYASPGVNWLSCASRDATALHALFTDTLGGETTLLTDRASDSRRNPGSF